MRYGGRAGILLDRGGRQAERGDREHPERGPVPGDAPQAVRGDGTVGSSTPGCSDAGAGSMRRPRRGRTRCAAHHAAAVGASCGGREHPRRPTSADDPPRSSSGRRVRSSRREISRCRIRRARRAADLPVADRECLAPVGGTRIDPGAGWLTSHSARAGACPSEETRMIRRPSVRPKRGDKSRSRSARAPSTCVRARRCRRTGRRRSQRHRDGTATVCRPDPSSRSTNGGRRRGRARRTSPDGLPMDIASDIEAERPPVRQEPTQQPATEAASPN